MHKESFEGMGAYINKYVTKPSKILDVGSLNYKGKGCYRPLIPSHSTYIGVDLQSGLNVDIVLPDPYKYPFPDNEFDFILSGQCFEHTPNPFKLIKELARILKPGGYFLGAAPYAWEVHCRPDCWRFLPDGWASLFEEANLTLIESYIVEHDKDKAKNWYGDCWGIAQK